MKQIHPAKNTQHLPYLSEMDDVSKTPQLQMFSVFYNHELALERAYQYNVKEIIL